MSKAIEFGAMVGLTVLVQSLLGWNDWTSYVWCGVAGALWALFRL